MDNTLDILAHTGDGIDHREGVFRRIERYLQCMVQLRPHRDRHDSTGQTQPKAAKCQPFRVPRTNVFEIAHAG